MTSMSRWYTVNEGELTAKGNVVEMNRKLDSLYLSPDVVVLDLVAKIGHSRVCGVVRAKDLDRLLHAVGLVDVIDWDFHYE